MKEFKILAKKEIHAHVFDGGTDYHITAQPGEELHLKSEKDLRMLEDSIEIKGYPTESVYTLQKPHKGLKAGEVVRLFGDVAWKLVLNGTAIPCDATLWRPGKPIPSTRKSFLGRAIDAFAL
jgi:hypothetical protein